MKEEKTRNLLELDEHLRDIGGRVPSRNECLYAHFAFSTFEFIVTLCILGCQMFFLFLIFNKKILNSQLIACIVERDALLTSLKKLKIHFPIVNY